MDKVKAGNHEFSIHIEWDDDNHAPWERADGHGPVSEWTTRDKRPGEWELNAYRSSKRYYDAAEAMRIARRDGWGLSDGARAELLEQLTYPKGRRRAIGRDPETRATIFEDVAPSRDPAKPLTAGEIAAEAVRRDFEFLRGWSNDEWHYVGVVLGRDGTPDYGHALWGIESDNDEYLTEVAQELADEWAAELDAEAQALRGKLAAYRSAARELIADLRQSDELRPAVCSAVRSQLQALREARRAAWAALEAACA